MAHPHEQKDDLLRRERSYIFESRLETATELRKIGNADFSDGNFQGALAAYDRAFFHLDFDEAQIFELHEKHVAQLNSAKAPLHLNKGLCLLKESISSDSLGDPPALSALKEALKFLELEPTSAKGLCLKGRALLALGRSDEAVGALKAAAEATREDVDKRAVAKLLRAATQAVMDSRTKQKELWGGKLLSQQSQSSASITDVHSTHSPQENTSKAFGSAYQNSTLIMGGFAALLLALAIPVLIYYSREKEGTRNRESTDQSFRSKI